MNTILFDLDGTLVPFMQDDFVHGYFGALAKKVVPLGYEKDALIAALWKGMGAMIRNDGSRLNREVFWQVFAQELGSGVLRLENILHRFYQEEFDAVRAVLTAPVDRSGLIRSLREKGYGLVLATNPVFPSVAVETRLSWVGLHKEDFDYVTTYENSAHSKPNPGYYRDVLEHIGKSGKECLMVGNNPTEDMVALTLGMAGYLVMDCIENPEKLPVDAYMHGSFCDLEQFLAALPAVKA